MAGGEREASPWTLLHLGHILVEHERFAEAEGLLRAALERKEGAQATSTRVHRSPRSELGQALLGQERYAEAESFFRSAVRIAESAGDRPGVGALLARLAEVQASMRRRDAADTARRAIAELSRELGADHPTTVDATFKLHALLERPS